MSGRTRTPTEWIRIVAAVGTISLLFVGGVAGRPRVCEEEALQSGAIVEVCRGPTVTDVVVVAGGVLVVLLLAKEFQEIGLFGFSLKNRVEQQEQRASKLEGAMALLTLKVDASAAATATANVILVTPDQVRGLRERAPEKAEEFLEGLRLNRESEG